MITKAKRFMKERFYFSECIYLLEHCIHTEQTSDVKIVDADESNIDAVLTFDSFVLLKRYKQFLRQGDVGFLAFANNELCVHRSWVQHYPRKVNIHFSYSMELNPNEVFIHYCETYEEYRGKNIYAHVLSEIAKRYEGKRVLVAINSKNKASLRSAEKAGFKKQKAIKVQGLLNKAKHSIILERD